MSSVRLEQTISTCEQMNAARWQHDYNGATCNKVNWWVVTNQVISARPWETSAERYRVVPRAPLTHFHWLFSYRRFVHHFVFTTSDRVAINNKK